MSQIKFDENKAPYVELGNEIVRLENDEPNDAIKEIARIQLRETPDIVRASLDELRTLVKAEKSLYIPTDDQFLIMFLRPCKFYSKSAFERIKKLYKLKQKHPKLFDDLFPSTVRHVYEQGVVRMLPKRDRNGVRFLFLEVGKNWKPSKCSLDDLFRAVLVAISASMREPTSQICGGIVLLDFDGLALTHIMQFTPSFAAMLLEWVQEALGLRLKSVHIFNNSYLFNMLFSIFKPFIQEKLRKRIFFHGKDTKSLMAHIDPNCLPQRYGGTLSCPELPGSTLADLFQLYNKEFEVNNHYGYTKAS